MTLTRILFAFFAAILLTLAAPRGAAAQTAYVQIEAQRTLSSATEKARQYAARLPDVTGHYLGTGWYGIALGPYTEADAERVLSALRSAGSIPADAYIVTGQNFEQQFWPVGVGAPTAPQPAPELDDNPALSPEDLAAALEAPEIAPAPEPEPLDIPDETPAEARASEALLTRPEREELQIALQWAGFYEGAIDAAFGPGTRASMRAWQEANNQEPTGILTSGQRATLLGAYNAVLEGMDLQLVRDDAAGIEMVLPTGVVEFTEYEPPFARFDAVSDELPVQVLLISQPGDQARFAGFYEILQTLEIVPPEGPRERSGGSFTIDGADSVRHTWVQASLEDGQIKGFALVWPAGDEDRRTRVLGEMRQSFTRLGGVLDPAIAPPDEGQSIDLVSGLEVRRPRLTRSGFYIDEAGTVLTTAEAVESCERITVDAGYEAQIAHVDADLGIAALRPDAALSPLGVAEFQTGVPRLQAEVAVAGFPYGSVLATPAVTFGRLADLRGLDGQEEVKRLTLTATEGDAGGPLFDNGGAVLGMLLPRPEDSAQVLPADVAIALDAEAIVASLTGAGIEVKTTNSMAFMAPGTLTLLAADMTVLVSCW